ncbi:protein suppressor of variegation 3-7 [Drosophila tropicalis]|uniref:protein suppressor of variegation 3-7 n=1 Tax=Drosophila tropicalis TaxID=46794 RepID=UPI0035ABBC6D
MQTGRIIAASENLADAGNKMASKTIHEHELKIMDVEGAVTECEEPSVTIEVDEDSGEDVDNNNVSIMLAELESSMNGKSTDKSLDPLMEETMSAKIEPSEDENECNPYHDPMGLLSRLDSNPENDSQDDDDDVSADDGSSGVSLKSRKQTEFSRWLIWMKRWPWLLHDETDGTYAYCLYCNTTLNVNKQTKFIKQHNLCMYHQEREKNYLAFKQMEAKKNETNEDDEVKHEFGTHSYVVAMKKKRSSEVEAFNDFNWERWLQEHEWLKRHEPQGTSGFCKACNVSMNVEFVYLRKRHEASKAHQQNQRQQGQEKSTRKRKRSASTSCDETSQPSQENNVANGPLVSIADGEIEAGSDPSAWCEFIPGTKYQQCRCTLCNIRMVITSFLRHCKTKGHLSNLECHNQKDQPDKYGIWSAYKTAHPWMVADPEDSSLAYCTVCCKRFMYGHSEIKRKVHENSEKHLAAMSTGGNEGAAAEDTAKEIPEAEQRDQTESDDSGDIDDHEEDDADEDEDDDGASMSRKSTRRRGHAKIKQPVRHYSWLGLSKDRKVQLCKFCRVRFRNETDKARHEFSERHKLLVKQFHKRKYARQVELRRLRNEQQTEQNKMDDYEQDNTDKPDSSTEQKPLNPAQIIKPLPATMRGKVMIWKDRYPWLSYKKNEERPNYGWCKLCEVSVFLPSYKFASKHQRTSKHIRLRLERKRIAIQSGNAEESTASILSTGEAKHKAAMQELQDKYDWLEPDATEENYCHCRICETRLPIKVFYLRQHDASRKHSENLERRKSNNVSNTAAPEAEAETQQQQPQQPNQEAPITTREREHDSDEDLSQKSDCSTVEPPQKRSRRSNEMRSFIRALRDSVGKRQEDRNQLELAKDMICSSFDIVTRLRTLERTQVPSDSVATPPPKNIESINTEPRHVMDLFLDSISATMKDLPSDLAAKGKAKIMQIVCDLEVEAMQRKAPITEHPQSSPTNPNPPMDPPSVNNSPGSQDTINCSETVEDEELSDEPLMVNSTNGNNINPKPYVTTTNLPEISIMSRQQRESAPNKTSKIISSPLLPQHSNINRSSKEVQSSGVFRGLNNSIQVTKIRADGATQDAVRCVPLDKLTMSNGRNGISPSKSNNNDLNNSANSSFLRNFRVSNGNVAKMSPVSKPTQIMVRLSGGTSSVSTNGGTSGVSQQYQAPYPRTPNLNQQRIHPSGR